MDFTVVIPARYDSSRLPGKPLMDIAGMTMIQRVYVQAKKSNATQVVVATDDQRIFDHVVSFDGQVCMTSENHQSGTDRLQEVTKKLGLPENHIVVNVQGDEPLIPPEVINQVASNLSANLSAGVATLCESINSKDDFNNPHVVKVVADKNSLAMFFSRAPIPYHREDVTYDADITNACFKPMSHIGIYAYRVSMLNKFVCWPAAPIEQVELLEQLRFLWNGEKIHVDQSIKHVPGGIDTQQDLEYAVGFLKKLS